MRPEKHAARSRIGSIGLRILTVMKASTDGITSEKFTANPEVTEMPEQFFSIVTDGFADTSVSLSTRHLYGTDIVASIIDAVHESNASAIVFTSRGGSRWRKLLTGDVSHKLVENSDIPTLVLPDEKVNNA
jgi:nucleotide-binding universal stress UspA family protein